MIYNTSSDGTFQVEKKYKNTELTWFLRKILLGLGKLEERQQEKGKKSAEILNAKTDFYKTMALDANQHHVRSFTFYKS